MPYNITDTIQESLPFFLKAEEIQVKPDSLQMNFGGYEFLPTERSPLFFDVDSTVTTTSQLLPSGIAGATMPFSPWVSSVIFLLILLCFVLFAFIFHKEGVALTASFKQIFTFGKRTALFRKEQVTITEAWGEFFMIVQTILIVSLLLFTYLWDKGLSSLSLRGLTLSFLFIFVCFSTLVGLKFLMYKTIGSFFLRSDMKNWITQYSRLFEMLGIVLFLPVVFYIYLHELRNIISLIFIILFFISRLVIVIELLNIFVKNKVGIFYFFAYLCGTEIAPYLLFYKGVLSIIGFAANNIV
ncbi:MAG: DUF4271 domain-containing protein [Proteiniphilum sp.]|nr:DUF4271 domain-containing protein [Proteiniphilum sp.]